jgi:hypothetical protein
MRSRWRRSAAWVLIVVVICAPWVVAVGGPTAQEEHRSQAVDPVYGVLVSHGWQADGPPEPARFG